ncbi:MAG: ammonia channel protein, partial [Acidobacteria bacterium]
MNQFHVDRLIIITFLVLISALTLRAQAPASSATNVDSRIAALQQQVADAKGSADNAWMLTSSALVLMMTGPGLALFYGGLVRKKNV